MKLQIATLLYVACGAISSLAADNEKKVEHLWQNTSLLLRVCPAANFVKVNAMKAFAVQTPGWGQGICLAEFSSVELRDNNIVFKGKMRQVIPTGDLLSLSPVKQVEPFEILADCRRRSLNDERIAALDKHLFLHLAIMLGTPPPEYFRTFLQKLVGLPVQRPESVTTINPDLPGDIGPRRIGVSPHRDELPKFVPPPSLTIPPKAGTSGYKEPWSYLRSSIPMGR